MSPTPAPQRAPLCHPAPQADGPHLLDVSAGGPPAGGVHGLLSARHAALAGLGWRHTVLAPGTSGAGHVDCGGLPLPWTGGHRLPLGQARLVRMIERTQPDLIEVADVSTLAWAALEASQRLHVPAVAFCHSNLPALAARLVGGTHGLGTRRGLWAARRVQAYLTDLYTGFDLVLAPSQSMARRLQQWGLRQVQCQPLGVDCRSFNPSATDAKMRRRITDHLQVPPSTRLLVYTGRFAADKNLDMLASAVDRLGPGHLLVAIGDGPCPPHGQRVRLLPPVTKAEHLARLLANADLYVHAGSQETFGQGALEAMACGLPVVLSATDGLGELAECGGLSVSGRRPADWTEAMRYALATNLDTLTAKALAHARTLDWPRVLGQMVQRYQWVLQQDIRQRQAGRSAVPRGAAAAGQNPPPPGLVINR